MRTLLQAVLVICGVLGAFLVDKSVTVKQSYNGKIRRELDWDKKKDLLAPSEVISHSALRRLGWGIIIGSAVVELGIIFFARAS